MKNKKTVIVIIACITLALTFTMLVSYAYWRVSKTQTGTNDINGACLSVSYEEFYDENENKIEGITLENAWPMSEYDGFHMDGYRFKVTNNCEESVVYQIILDSLPVSSEKEEMDYQYVKVLLRGVSQKVYDTYDSFYDMDLEPADYDSIASKRLYIGIIPGTEDTINYREFNLRMWISEESPKEEIGKVFNSKIRVVAGQEAEFVETPESCFDFESETGTIIGYDEDNCTTDYLVVPSRINGVTVKSVDLGRDIDDIDNDTDGIYDSEIEWYYLDLTKATGLETIGINTFHSYTGIGQKLVIPDSVKNIEAGAFYKYNGTKLTLGNSLEIIGQRAFAGYRGFNQVLVIPNSVRIIGAIDDYYVDYWLYGSFRCFRGTDLILGNSVEYIGPGSFYQYEGTNKKLIIPDSVTTIEYFAFDWFSGTNLLLGSGIENIYYRAFSSYNGVIDINMSENEFNMVNINNPWNRDLVTLNYLQ